MSENNSAPAGDVTGTTTEPTVTQTPPAAPIVPESTVKPSEKAPVAPVDKTPSNQVRNGETFKHELGVFSNNPQIAVALSFLDDNNISLSQEAIDAALGGDLNPIRELCKGLPNEKVEMYMGLIQHTYDVMEQAEAERLNAAINNVHESLGGEEVTKAVLDFFEQEEDQELVDQLNDILMMGGKVGSLMAFGMKAVFDHNNPQGIQEASGNHLQKRSGTKTIAPDTKSGSSNSEGKYQKDFAALKDRLDRGEISIPQWQTEWAKLQVKHKR